MRAHSRPTVGVVIPVYNAPRRVVEAVESVLAQTHPVARIAIVDDGSTDETPGVADGLRARDPRIAVFRQANAGPAAARNRGLRELNTARVAFLDSDDVWSTNKIEVQSRVLDDHPDAVVVMGLTEGVSLSGPAPGKARPVASWAPRRFLQLGAMLFERRAFDEVGPFDESLRFGEDLDWCMRAGERELEFCTHDDRVLQYRRHGNNLTNDVAGRNRGALQALRRAIVRRRQVSP